MRHRFYTLDVFTTTRFQGNPLAVVTDGDGFSNDPLTAALWPAFAFSPPSKSCSSPVNPVVGTWFLLAELGVVPAQEGGVHILQQTGAGILPVEIRFKDGRPQRVTMTQKVAAFKSPKFTAKKLGAALGVAPKDLGPHLEPEIVSSGVFNLMVPFRNRTTLGKIQMNIFEMSRLLNKQATMAYCFANGSDRHAFARGMLPWEIYEDAATGSAAGSLGAYMVKHGKLGAGHTLHIAQGLEMGRPSEIEVEVSQNGKKLTPRVSGAAVKVLEGVIVS